MIFVSIHDERLMRILRIRKVEYKVKSIVGVLN